jgi:hypothetical protein
VLGTVRVRRLSTLVRETVDLNVEAESGKATERPAHDVDAAHD